MALQAPPRVQGESSQERKWKEEVTRLANLSGAGSSVVDAKYVVTELDASLTNEKLLAPSTDIEVVTDASSVSLVLKDTGVTAGAYDAPTLTVDAKGRVIAISAGTSALPSGGSEGQILTVIGGVPTWSDMDMKQYALELDDVGGGILYVGEAEPGTATSSALWRIKRLTELSGDVTVEWANGTSDFDQVWDDRLSLSYS